MNTATLTIIDSIAWIILAIENGRTDVAIAMLRELANKIAEGEK